MLLLLSKNTFKRIYLILQNTDFPGTWKEDMDEEGSSIKRVVKLCMGDTEADK